MRIFNLGLPKTGTKSLKFALQILGFREGKKEDFPRKSDRFYSFDWVHQIYYKDLVEKYPDSIFLLTCRDSGKWYRSECKWSLMPGHIKLRRLLDQRIKLYGHEMPQGHKKDYIRRYREHYRRVVEYFRSINKKIHILEWEEGAHQGNWKQLCRVFNLNAPDMPFPHENRQDFN